MGKRPRKKVVLFLVEGQSEINALSYAIPQLFDNLDDEYEVLFPILRDEKQTGGDITSKYGVRPNNIERLISELFVKNTLRDYGLYPKDIEEIVHIVDTDGAYIEDCSIKETRMASTNIATVYNEDSIETPSPQSIKERNERKRANIDHLTSLSTIKIESKSIKYSIFYMSCNLDHYIHGVANMDNYAKCKKAEEFTDICISNPEYFEKTFDFSNTEMANMSYAESWEYIKEDNHSLERHSNLNILIKRIKDQF